MWAVVFSPSANRLERLDDLPDIHPMIIAIFIAAHYGRIKEGGRIEVVCIQLPADQYQTRLLKIGGRLVEQGSQSGFLDLVDIPARLGAADLQCPLLLRSEKGQGILRSRSINSYV